MIEIDNKAECCGCSACYSVCPKGAIEMRSDFEGFTYPHVNEDMCICCSMCDKVCPIKNNVLSEAFKRKSYVVRAKNMETVSSSTSGGFVTPLAKWIIEKNGVVCGAVFNKDYKVIHSVISTGGG